MHTARKIFSIGVLVAVSVLLTAAVNSFAGTIYDYAHNLYFAGTGSLAGGLLIHVLIVRRLLPVNRTAPQLIGVAISGVISVFLHDLFRDLTAHITFVQRKGTTINWGDDGIYSGLPALGTGFEIGRIISDFPSIVVSAFIYGIVWFPLLVLLERWAYGLRRSPGQSTSGPADINPATPERNNPSLS